MKSGFSFVRFGPLAAAIGLLFTLPLSAQQPPPTARPSVYQTTLEEPGQLTAEITTEQLLEILASKSEPVFDVRTAREYAIAHIPGTINIYEKEVDQIAAYFADPSTARLILYCNGPSCGKSKRTSEQLLARGFVAANVRRYQLGLPVWRALSLTVQTDMPGLDYVYRGDHTAVFVDARTPGEFVTGSMPGAVNVQKGEATAANDDGRLPFTDKGTRVVVFANTAADAKVVAAEIAKKAYWNSSYFGGSFGDLLAAGFINHPPVAASRNATVGAGATCTATIAPATIDAGSYDPDTGDVLTLAVSPAGPLPLGEHAVSLIATDTHGASQASTSSVAVADTTGPIISDVVVDHSMLWPPSSRMRLVSVDYTAVDNCGPATTALTVSSAGPERGDRHDDEAERADWKVLDAHHVLLRAEGDGHRDHAYTITINAIDDAGNRSAHALVVHVARARD